MITRHEHCIASLFLFFCIFVKRSERLGREGGCAKLFSSRCFFCKLTQLIQTSKFLSICSTNLLCFVTFANLVLDSFKRANASSKAKRWLYFGFGLVQCLNVELFYLQVDHWAGTRICRILLSSATPAWTLISRLKFDWILRLVKAHRLRECPLAAWSANMPDPPVIWSPFKCLNIRTRFYWISFCYTSVSSIVPSHSQFISQLVWNMYIVRDWQRLKLKGSPVPTISKLCHGYGYFPLLSNWPPLWYFSLFWILWWFLALIYFMVISLPLSHVKTRGRWLPYDRVIQSISLTWNSQVGNHTWY